MSRVKRKIKKGDEVIVIAGKEKGKRGTILAVQPTLGKVQVEGLNLRVKHVKQQGASSQTRVEAFVDISNVALVNSSTGMPEKVGFMICEDGKKRRYFKKSKEVISE